MAGHARTPDPSFHPVAEIRGDPARMRVYEHGWQSWSPAGLYPGDATSPRPLRDLWQTMAFRPERPAPAHGFQGEGLLAVLGNDGGARTFLATDPTSQVASIRAEALGDRLLVTADGPVAELPTSPSLDEALAAVAARLAPDGPSERAAAGLGPGWCSYYGYSLGVTETDVLENLTVIERERLPIRVVQVDDGYETGIGDWTTTSPRFGPLHELAARIRDTGREAGIWTAPFLAGADSAVARLHPEWLVGGAIASPNHWGQEIRVLDVTHPDAAAHLAETFRTLVRWGFTFHKLDFIYGGAIPGRRHEDVTGVEAYRIGMELIRDAVGPDAVLLGCGAPLLPSVGLVDAMRVSPDVDDLAVHPSGDISQPSVRGALAAGRARAWMHGRLWVNDPDCLIVRAQLERRDEWAAHVAATGGLVIAGDRLPELDGAGLDRLRAGLRASTVAPTRWEPGPDPDGGRIVSAGS